MYKSTTLGIRSTTWALTVLLVFICSGVGAAGPLVVLLDGITGPIAGVTLLSGHNAGNGRILSIDALDSLGAANANNGPNQAGSASNSAAGLDDYSLSGQAPDGIGDNTLAEQSDQARVAGAQTHSASDDNAEQQRIARDLNASE